MQLSQIPVKFSLIWGEAAAAGTIRTVPLAPSGQAGAASWETGFPSLNFVQVASGGVPPFGQDFNGILAIITAWGQWAQAGGAQPFDPTFATAIGGYPKSCILPAASQAGVWYNLADNNTANPDSGGANWALIGPAMAVGGDLTGTIANAIIRNGVVVAAMVAANTLTGAQIVQAPAAGFFGALGAGNGGWLSIAQSLGILGVGPITGNVAATGHIIIPVASEPTLLVNWGFTKPQGPATFDKAFSSQPYVVVTGVDFTVPATYEDLTTTGMNLFAGSGAGVGWIVLGPN